MNDKNVNGEINNCIQNRKKIICFINIKNRFIEI